MTHHAPLPCLAFACLAFATVLFGCATAPQPSSSATPAAVRELDCRQLSAEIAAAKEVQRAALDKEENAWKAVIPVAVVARYAQGKKAAGEAQQRIGELQAAAQRKACVTPW